MTARRFLPVSIEIVGDIGATDASVIRAANEMLDYHNRRSPSMRLQLQPLDPAQFVIAPPASTADTPKAVPRWVDDPEAWPSLKAAADKRADEARLPPTTKRKRTRKALSK